MAAALGVGTAFAHTALTGSYPGDGDELTSAPEMIHLRFSEKLEKETSLHKIELAGPDAAPIEVGALTLSDDGTMLMAALPQLVDGAYKVSYRVISSDGHPVKGSFSFKVTAPEPIEEEPLTPTVPPEPEAPPAVQPTPDPAPPASGGHEGHDPEENTAVTETSYVFNAFLFISRVLYYAALLSLLGWALWSAFRSFTEEQEAYWRRIGIRLQLLHLVILVLYVLLHWTELAGDHASTSFLDALRNTETGQSWLFTGLLSLAGFPLLFRYRMVDGVWVLLMIVARTLQGHAGAFEPVVWSRLADGVHLGAASLWTGGLLALLLLLGNNKEDWFRGFAPTFSKAALGAVAALAVTGVISASLYLEQPSDLPRTAWGWLLIGKAALAIAVLPVAALLRRKLRSADTQPNSFGQWLRADAALLAGIIAITGILTHVSPIVERVVFHWHVMGETAHLTAEIADVRAGKNTLSLKVWTPDTEGEPTVTVVVAVPGKPDAAAELEPVDIPKEDWESFPGFNKYTYSGKVTVADPKQAEMRIRVVRANGETLDYEKTLVDP